MLKNIPEAPIVFEKEFFPEKKKNLFIFFSTSLQVLLQAQRMKKADFCVLLLSASHRMCSKE